MSLQYIGFRSLDEEEAEKLSKISEKEYPKIERTLPTANIILRIKKYKEKGKKNKYSIHAKIEAPNTKIVAQTADWDIAKTTHKVFNKLQTEINHKFKV